MSNYNLEKYYLVKITRYYEIKKTKKVSVLIKILASVFYKKEYEKKCTVSGDT